MAGVVERVVSQRAQGERVLVRVARVADQRLDEVAGPDVVREIGEQMTAERVVPEVLDEGAAVRVRAGFSRSCSSLSRPNRCCSNPAILWSQDASTAPRCAITEYAASGLALESMQQNKRANHRAGPWRGKNLASHRQRHS